jgi:hypothetical protein
MNKNTHHSPSTDLLSDRFEHPSFGYKPDRWPDCRLPRYGSSDYPWIDQLSELVAYGHWKPAATLIAGGRPSGKVGG